MRTLRDVLGGRDRIAALGVLAALLVVSGYLRLRRFGLLDIFEDGYHHWWIGGHLAQTGLYVDPFSRMTNGSWLPGYYPLMAVAYDAAGWGALAGMRAVSLVASLATLVLVFLVARRRGLLAATFAGLFYALVIQDALIASMALPESLAVLAVFAAVYLLFAATRGTERMRWIAASLLLLAAGTLRYEAWLAAALLFFFVWRVRKASLRNAVLLVLPAALFALLWILVLLPAGGLPSIVFGQTAREAQFEISRGGLAADPLTRLAVFWGANFGYGLVPLFVLGPGYMLVRQRREFGTWLSLALFAGVSVLVAGGVGTGSYRYTTLAVPFLCVSAGFAVAALLRRVPRLHPKLRRNAVARGAVVAACAGLLIAASVANTAWITPQLDSIGQLSNPLERAGKWIAAHPPPNGTLVLSDSAVATYCAHVDPAHVWSSWWLPANRTEALATLRAQYAYVVFVNVSYYPLVQLFPELAGGQNTPDFRLAYDPNGWELQYGAKLVYVYAPQ